MRSTFCFFPAILLLLAACDSTPDCGGDLRYDPDMQLCVCDHEWDPDAGVCIMVDAGADGCIASAEMCNGRDDDCDGESDEAAATAECSSGPEIVAGACTAGACVIATCREGSADCNGSFEDGCEVDLATAQEHCGACGSACEVDEICLASACSTLPIHRSLLSFTAESQGSEINAIAIGADGTAYIAGTFTTSIRLGTRTLMSRGRRDAFIASIASSGTVRWVEQVGGPAVDEVKELAIGVDGQLFAVGRITEEIVIGAEVLRPLEDDDAFVVVFDQLGAVVAHRVLGGPGSDVFNDIAIDEDGRVFVALAADHEFDVDGVALSAHGSVLAFGADLTLSWARAIPSQFAHVWSIAARGGHVLAVGHFTAPIDMGDGHVVTSRGDEDAFFVRWSSEGELGVWFSC